MKSLAWK